MGTKFPFIRYDYRILGGNMIYKKFMILSIIAGIFILTGCSQAAEKQPDDFTLYYYWNTGALAPEYYYQYEIEIGPAGNGILTLQNGYEEDDENEKIFEFAVSQSDWNDFFDWLNENKILRKNWKESGEILLGGSTTEVKLQVNGEKYIVPSVSVLSQNEREIYYALEEQIKLLVPADIWKQIE
jgi:hypothetical protein